MSYWPEIQDQLFKSHWTFADEEYLAYSQLEFLELAVILPRGKAKETISVEFIRIGRKDAGRVFCVLRSPDESYVSAWTTGHYYDMMRANLFRKEMN